MSAATNTFLRLNSSTSQPGSPTSLKSRDIFPVAGSSGTAGIGKARSQSLGGGGGGNSRSKFRCGAALVHFFSSHPRIRKGLAHLALVLLLGFYTAAGASVRSFSIIACSED
jgi:hypothetical protein